MSFRLGHFLVQQQRLTLEQVEQAFHREQLFGGGLDTHLLELGWFEPDELQSVMSLAYKDDAPLVSWMESPALSALLCVPSALALQLELLPVHQADGVLHLLAAAGTMSDQWPLSYWLGQTIQIHHVPYIRILQGLHKLYQHKIARRWLHLSQRFSTALFQPPEGWAEAASDDSSAALTASVRSLAALRESSSLAASDGLAKALEGARFPKPMRSEQPHSVEATQKTDGSSQVETDLVDHTPMHREKRFVESTAKTQAEDSQEKAALPSDTRKEEKAALPSDTRKEEKAALSSDARKAEHDRSPENAEPSTITAGAVETSPPRQAESAEKAARPSEVSDAKKDLSQSAASRLSRERAESTVSHASNENASPAASRASVEKAEPTVSRASVEKAEPREETEAEPEKAVEPRVQKVEKATEPQEQTDKADTKDEASKKSVNGGESKLALPPVSSLRNAFRPTRNITDEGSPERVAVQKARTLPAQTSTGAEMSLAYAVGERDEKPSAAEAAEVSSVSAKQAEVSVKRGAEKVSSASEESALFSSKPSVMRAADLRKQLPSIVVESEPTLMLGPAEVLSEESNYTVPMMAAMPAKKALDVEDREQVVFQDQTTVGGDGLDVIEIDVDLGASLEPPPSSAETIFHKQTAETPNLLLEELFLAPLDRVPQLLETLSSFGGEVVIPMLEHLPAQDVVGKNTDLEEKLERMVMICEKIDEPALLRLIRVLQKEAPPTRMRALLLLGKWLSPHALSHLIRQLLIEQDGAVRRMIRKVILSYKEEGGFEKLLPFLVNNLQSGDLGRIKNALQLIEELRITEAIPELIKSLASKEKEVREQSERVLRHLALQSFGLDGRQWNQWYSLQSQKTRKHWILDALNHEDEGIRRMVKEDLRDEFGDDFGYDPEASPTKRESIRKLAALWLQQR